MAEIDIRNPNTIALKSATGELREVPIESAREEAAKNRESFASPEEISAWNTREKYGNTGAEVAGLGTLALGTATGGLLAPPQGSEQLARQQYVQAEHPYAAGATEMAAVALPAMVGGEALSGAGALADVAVGGLARGAAEGAVAGLATEGRNYVETDTPISAGNIAISSLGGALMGEIIPRVLSRGDAHAALPSSPAQALAEGTESIVPELERSSAEHAAAAVEHLPEGEMRAATADRTAPIRREQAAADIADVEATAPAALEKSDLSRADLKRLVAKDSPAQTDWATQLATDLRRSADEIESSQQPISAERTVAPENPPAESGPRETLRSAEPTTPAPEPQTIPVTTDGKPVSLIGKSLEDLGVSSKTGMKQESLDFLRQDERFGRTGKGFNPRVSDEALDKIGTQNGIILRPKGDGYILQDGRHRITVGRERGLTEIYGRVLGNGNRVLYEGMIPIAERAAPAAAEAAGSAETAAAAEIRRAPSGARIAEMPSKGAPDFADWDLGDFQAGRGRSRVHANQGQYGGTAEISQYQRSIVDGLKENAEFQRTGRVSGDAGKLGSEPTFELTSDGTVKLHHGKMRIIAARELERDTIYGRIVRGSGRDAETVYEGPVKVGTGKAAPEPTAAPPAAKAPNSDAIDIALRQGKAADLAPHAGSVDALRAASDSLLDSKGALDTLLRARQALAELRRAGASPEVIARLESGVADQSLWGRAGEAVADYERSAQGDLAQRLEDRAAARAKWQAAGDKDRTTRRLLQDAQRVRRASAVSEPSTPPEPAATPPAPSPAGVTQPGANPLEAAGHAVSHKLGHMAMGAVLGHGLHGAGLAMMAGKAVWSAIGANGRAVIAATARRVARGSLESAALGAPAATGNALDHFARGFSGPREAYAARVHVLQQMAQNPGVLPHAMAQALGDLPEHDPQLYGEISARMARATTYVSQHLPASIATSLSSPRGVPPSQDALREFAVVWNSAMHPETVLASVAAGTASAQQIRTLQAVDPDSYAQLLADITTEVGQNFAAMSSQRKQHLDIIFASDGIAGPCYSWRAAEHIQEHLQSTQGQQAKPLAGASAMSTPRGQDSAPNARGLSAIAAGVTNRAA